MVYETITIKAQGNETGLPEPPPLDFKRTLEEFDGDMDLLMTVIETFMEDVEGQIVSIYNAKSGGDFEIICREAHAIKGGAGNLAAEDLSQIAFELEEAGRSGSLTGCGEALERLKGEFHRLRDYVKGA